MAEIAAGNHYDLRGRVAVITGGAGGVGQGVARAFAQSGAAVVIVEREELRTHAEEQAAHLDTSAGQAHTFLPADVLDEASVAALVAAVLARHQRLDILVNLVGGYTAGQPISELDLATWQRMQDLNLRSAFLMSKHAAQAMIARRAGRILNISARGARSGRKNAGAYAVAKSGIITLTEVQAEEVLEYGITVNCLLPSIIDTPANRAAMPNAKHDRWPTPEAVARVLLFLASDDAQLISGAAIPVYGQA
ncbi:MAG TPA: SDR family NAD(P)-dependent oxidoreductase [Ktedonobacterales bacterium]|jgi:NAD(P)-dependent dehydrogenase (short-subunit alcohol dehydrogenase family)